MTHPDPKLYELLEWMEHTCRVIGMDRKAKRRINDVRAAIQEHHANALRTAVEQEREKQNQEIVQLRGLALELSQTLAKRCLVDANAEVAGTGNWPGGQDWDDLAGTSQSIMRRRGWAEAGLDAERVVALMCDEYGSYKEYDAEPLRSRSTPPHPTAGGR